MHKNIQKIYSVLLKSLNLGKTLYVGVKELAFTSYTLHIRHIMALTQRINLSTHQFKSLSKRGIEALVVS